MEKYIQVNATRPDYSISTSQEYNLNFTDQLKGISALGKKKKTR